MAGIEVKIGADTTGLDSGVAKSKTSLKGLGKEVGELSGNMAKMGLAAAAAGAAMAAALTVKGLAAVDAQAKLSRQLGATNDGLRAVQLAASDAGVSTGSMNSALEKLNQRVGEAMRGTGEAAKSFGRLGLSAQELAPMDADQRMAAIADRMKEMGLSSSQAADELRQMGIRSGEVVNLMMQGGDAIRAARGEVDSLGLSLSAVDAAKVEAANDSFARVGLVVDGVAQQLAIEVAPILDAISKQFVGAAKEAGGMGEAVGESFGLIVDSAAFVMDVVEGIKRAFTVAADLIIAQWSGMAGAIATVIGEVISLMNEIPSVNLDDAEASVKSFAQESIDAANFAVDNISATLERPLPSGQFKAFVAEAKEAAQVAAEEAVAVREAMAQAGGGAGGGGSQVSEEEKAKLESKLQAIRDANATELELLASKYAAEVEIMREGLANKQLTEDEARELSLGAAERYAQSKDEIERNSKETAERLAEAERKNKQSIMKSALSGLTSLMNSESRKMFEVGKAAAISSAIVDTYMGMTKALAQLGPIAGPIAAVAIGATGFANVASIRAQSFGGGGGSATGSNTGQINAATTQTGGGGAGGGEGGPRQVVNVALNGQFFSREMVRDMLPMIGEELQDGGVLGSVG